LLLVGISELPSHSAITFDMSKKHGTVTVVSIRVNGQTVVYLAATSLLF
jgi:hypothetical protein